MSGDTNIGQRFRTARRAHACYCCTDPIAPGTRYLRWAAIQDGRISTMKTHPGCARLWPVYDEQGDGLDPDWLHQMLFDWSWDEVVKELAEFPPDEIERIHRLWVQEHAHETCCG